MDRIATRASAGVSRPQFAHAAGRQCQEAANGSEKFWRILLSQASDFLFGIAARRPGGGSLDRGGGTLHCHNAAEYELSMTRFQWPPPAPGFGHSDGNLQ